MVRVLMGLKGSGKTKKLLEMVDKAIEVEQGDIAVIEATSKLMHEIPQKVRLIDASDYDFNGYEFMKGFITGLYCANYDLTHIFIEGLLKIVNKKYDAATDEFLDWCFSFGKREEIKFTVTISEDLQKATDKIRKYL